MCNFDKKKTIKNVVKFLREYKRFCRLSGEQYEKKLTEDNELVPITEENVTIQDENIAPIKVKASEVLEKIYDALEDLQKDQRKLIWDHHILNRMSRKVIREEIPYSERKYFEYLNLALIDFAKAFNDGELLES